MQNPPFGEESEKTNILRQILVMTLNMLLGSAKKVMVD